MDIVDKVFEGLSLSDQADKTRKITAHQRKKEMRKRLHLRLGILMGSAAAVIGLTVTGVILSAPKGSVADSDVEVEFSTPVVEEEAIVETVEVSTEKSEDATEATPVTTTKTSAPVTTKKTPTKQTTTVTPKTTKILNVLDSNGEKLDQGSNNCRTLNGNLLMCDNNVTPAAGADEGDKTDSGEGDKTEEDPSVTGA